MPRLTRAEKLVLIGVMLALVVISYFVTPTLARRAAEHERARTGTGPAR